MSGDPWPLTGLERELAQRLEPVAAPGPAPSAAVAAVFRDAARGAEVLLIERVQRLGDPWSGHMAFPGGRVDPADATPLDTARRETLEETGLELAPAEALGRLTEQSPRSRNDGLRVAAYVFSLGRRDPALSGNEEVADMLWMPISALLDPGRYRDYVYPPLPGVTFPAIDVEALDGAGAGRPAATPRVIWGLTLRFLEDLFERLGIAFPVR